MRIHSCLRQVGTLAVVVPQLGASAPSEGIRLVRLGESLVERIQKITDLDDRGRAVAMWRHHRRLYFKNRGTS